MRLAAPLLALSLAFPALAAARDDRPTPRSQPDARATPDDRAGDLVLAQYAPPPPPRSSRPVPSARPAPYARPVPAPAPRGGRPYRTYVGPGAGGSLSFWGGWGWGWGYYPLYPAYPRAAPPYPPAGGPDGGYYSPGDGAYPPGEGAYPPGAGAYPPGAGRYPAADPDRVFVRLGLAAAGMTDGAVGGFTLGLDSRTVGFSASADALVVDDVTRAGDTGGDALGWGSAHLTWTVLADAAFRVRLELGGSMLSLPTTGAFAPLSRAGDVAFGPDVGFSAQLGLVGPIGIEGHARITPLPITVVDSRLALALRGGPLAVTAGWRGIRVHGEAGEVPDVDFSGPELGLSLAF